MASIGHTIIHQSDRLLGYDQMIDYLAGDPPQHYTAFRVRNVVAAYPDDHALRLQGFVSVTVHRTIAEAKAQMRSIKDTHDPVR